MQLEPPAMQATAGDKIMTSGDKFGVAMRLAAGLAVTLGIVVLTLWRLG